MDPDKNLGALIDTLVDKTRNGRLEWSSTPLTSAYNVTFPVHSVTVRRIGSGILPNYALTIQNSLGEEIESFTSMIPGDSYYASLEELFNRARRKAMAADEAIAQIQAELAKV
ncbi:MAG: hypothetical protein OXL97_15465 [Chloroflexota bacterium]|nr:hypothetical protein [Chloroflexota bacterium]MDE2884168.1 hypothetical protein [Chloroflexota bacterium]